MNEEKYVECENEKSYIEYNFCFTRGDTHEFYFQRQTKDGTIIEEVPKEIYFTVKKNDYIKEYVIQKRLSDNTIMFDTDDSIYIVKFNSSDTENLEYGKYYYDIVIIYDDDEKKTRVKGALILTKETTFNSNEVISNV